MGLRGVTNTDSVVRGDNAEGGTHTRVPEPGGHGSVRTGDRPLVRLAP